MSDELFSMNYPRDAQPDEIKYRLLIYADRVDLRNVETEKQWTLTGVAPPEGTIGQKLDWLNANGERIILDEI